MESLQNVLMNRDRMTEEEALDVIDQLRHRVRDGEDPEELLHSELGLEPDYIFDLL